MMGSCQLRWSLGLILEKRVGVDRRTRPPLFFGAKSKDGEMQVWRQGVCVTAGADVTEHVSSAYGLSFFQVCRIPVKMGVVIDPLAAWIILVDGKPAGHAVEQLDDGAIFNGNYRGPRGGHDIQRLMNSAITTWLFIIVIQILRPEPLYRHGQWWWRSEVRYRRLLRRVCCFSFNLSVGRLFLDEQD